VILAIDTATEACSVALFDHGKLVVQRHEIVGRGHAERLIPEIARLPDGGRADEIWVDAGPGSFTGVRIGIAAAKGLAIAWSATLRAFPCHALVAASFVGDHEDAGGDALIAMDGGHGEWLIAPVSRGVPVAAMRALSPDDAIAFGQHIVIGSRAADLVALRGEGSARALFPSARHAHLIADGFIGDGVAPIYARAPDATPMLPLPG